MKTWVDKEVQLQISRHNFIPISLFKDIVRSLFFINKFTEGNIGISYNFKIVVVNVCGEGGVHSELWRFGPTGSVHVHSLFAHHKEANATFLTLPALLKIRIVSIARKSQSDLSRRLVTLVGVSWP